MKYISVISILAIVSLALANPLAAKAFWAKGNVHTHSNESDGNVAPQAVADWFRTHGYQFLMITDHNKLTDPAKITVPQGFLLIPGEELSAGYGKIPIHVNALGIDKPLAPVTGTSRLDTLRKNIDVVVDAGGLPLICHPNWYYALADREVSRAGRCNLVEIRNESDGCNNDGDATHPSMDAMWDAVLTKGVRMYGLATDDSHNYTKFPGDNTPGRGWIACRVSKLTRQEVLSAISRGDFYASTGVELQDVRFRNDVLSVAVKPAEGKTFRIQFIGPGGKVLDEVNGTKASHAIPDGADAYIRAKVFASDGTVAWVQPQWREK